MPTPTRSPEPTPDQTFCDVGRHQACGGYTEDESDPESCMCNCHTADLDTEREATSSDPVPMRNGPVASGIYIPTDDDVREALRAQGYAPSQVDATLARLRSEGEAEAWAKVTSEQFASPRRTPMTNTTPPPTQEDGHDTEETGSMGIEDETPTIIEVDGYDSDARMFGVCGVQVILAYRLITMMETCDLEAGHDGPHDWDPDYVGEDDEDDD